MIKKTLIDEKNIFIVLAIYAFVLLFFCSLMSPLYPFNDWSDINLYFNIGKAIFHGQTLYTEVFDHKGLLIFVIYGLGSLISSDSFIGMYFIESLAWVFMIFGAYLIARLYLDKAYAFIVALFFPVLMLSHSSEGGSAEEFIVLFEVVSLYLFIRYFKDKHTSVHKPSWMLVHGMMCTIVLLIKINLVVFWFFPLLAVLINLLVKKEYKNLFHNILTFIAGVMIVILPVILYFWLNNALSYAWDTYIVLNKTYARLGDFSRIMENLIVRFYQRLKYDNYEFLIILIGAIYFPVRYIGNIWGKIGLILSFAALYIVIFMPANYVFYYSIPYYIFCITGIIAILDIVSRYQKLQSRWYVFLPLFLVALSCGIATKGFFGKSKEVIFREKAKDDTVLYKFYNVIAKEKNPTLMILGLDATTGIFTKANIMPTVKYFISPNLPYDIYPDMRDEQTRYIREKKVQFVILSGGSFSYDYYMELPVLQENYDLVSTFEENGRSTYFLYKRKD
ncbi:glycosyltransferase family 39 protein [Prevotella sp. 10(H)]|uniref:ArnT family glycosyltransferase n=1 Tax=Prevotella sp. 10(H) TaxID=1158294 RepID=UPI0004A6B198|nr:glycosyltransferase family 39 protein [Prevotella sp. 10(H)]